MNEKCPSILEAQDAEGRPFSFPCHSGLEHHGNHVHHGGKYGGFTFTISWSGPFKEDAKEEEK